MKIIERVLQEKGDAPYLIIDDFTAIEACGVYKGYGWITSINCKGYRQAYLDLPLDSPFKTLEMVAEIIDEKMIGFVSSKCVLKDTFKIHDDEIFIGIYGPLFKQGFARQTAREIFRERYMSFDTHNLPEDSYCEEVSVHDMEVLCLNCIEHLISGKKMNPRVKNYTLKEKILVIEEANDIIESINYLKAVVSEQEATDHVQRCIKAIHELSKFVHEELVRKVGLYMSE